MVTCDWRLFVVVGVPKPWWFVDGWWLVVISVHGSGWLWLVMVVCGWFTCDWR